MDQVEFRLVEMTEFGTGAVSVVPHVNGRSLIDLAREVEMPFATEEEHPSIAGAYMGLARRQCAWPSLHLLGRPVITMPDGHTVLLGCDCGDWGCWPLSAMVTVDDDIVEWSDFQQPHRKGWDYTGLGPFQFDRNNYEQAVRSI